MNEKLKNRKGITLIALVVTIVVLLILAGVSISLILDNNGIIQKSKQARKEYGQAKENEQADLANISDWIEKETGADENAVVEPQNINDWKYDVQDDETVIITGYCGTATEVIIPNSINGKKVKKIYKGRDNLTSDGAQVSIWEANISSSQRIGLGSGYTAAQDTITKIKISNGIEEIGSFAFFGTINLREVELPKSLKKIEKYAFSYCNKLEKVQIPDNVTSIGWGAFIDCTKLSNVVISNNMQTIENFVFSGCESLTNITIPGSVTTMGMGVFYSIPSITVNVPFKENKIPEGWNKNWNNTNVNCTITVNYAK